jgi:N-acetyltransferase
MDACYPLCLFDEQVALWPLEATHAEALYESGKDSALWHLSAMRVASLEDMRALVATFLADQSAGTALPFVIVERQGQRIIGSTQIHSIVRAYRQVEVGKTWLAADWWSTGINTACKYLLLAHCFETLQCLRVQFRVDGRNLRSQQALERIGAQWEGRLRHNAILPDGFVRDTVYYSILLEEWLACKDKLMQRLHQQRTREA